MLRAKTIMINTYSSSGVHIYFGDASSGVPRELCDTFIAQKDLGAHPVFNMVKDQLNLEALITLKQVHGDNGYIVSATTLELLTHTKQTGDYLLTNLKHIGLAVYTADCLPVILYDPKHQAAAICHSGWPGSVKSIAIKALHAMQDAYGTDLEDIQVFFGPSALICCYQVQDEFRSHVKNMPYAPQLFRQDADNRLFFDLSLLNKLQLQSIGISDQVINCDYNTCTIDNTCFCSYRRERDRALRQLTVIALN